MCVYLYTESGKKKGQHKEHESEIKMKSNRPLIGRVRATNCNINLCDESAYPTFSTDRTLTSAIKF